jgi:hypothetical protein
VVISEGGCFDEVWIDRRLVGPGIGGDGTGANDMQATGRQLRPLEPAGNEDACYDPSRMAQCKSSGQYVAPTGRVWEASKR